jgi:uncharacterized membrane protein
MKKILLPLLFLILPWSVFSMEYIKHYDIDIVIESDGNLLITEKITAQVEGNIIKRGLMRDFPTRYKDRFGNNYVVGFEVLSVKRNGANESYHLKNRMNGVEVYTGDENRFLDDGLHIFEITYRTSHQIGFFENYDELYFNAIGGGWAFSIAEYRVSIHLPKNAKMIENSVFSGEFGSTAHKAQVQANDSTLIIASNEILEPGEQLTFVVSWNKGIIQEPSFLEKLLWLVRSNLNIIVAILGILIVFYIYMKRWIKYGRDPRKGTIIPLFDPPNGYSPSVIGFLYKTRMRSALVSATLVNMAIKGALKIVQNKKITGSVYTLEQLTNETMALDEDEKEVFQILFNGRNSVELSNKNHAVFQAMSACIDGSIDKNVHVKYYNNNVNQMILPGVLSVVFVILSFVAGPNLLIGVFAFLVFALLYAIFMYLIPAPTKEGRKMMDEVAGFRMYLVTAESQFLNDAHKPDLSVERFEALLPYAIALGVENEWGKKFSHHLKSISADAEANYKPLWYSGMAASSVFHADAFAKSIGSSFNNSISSSSMPPGSSSGSGGGGFSGGGGGGGGGGGW